VELKAFREKGPKSAQEGHEATISRSQAGRQGEYAILAGFNRGNLPFWLFRLKTAERFMKLAIFSKDHFQGVGALLIF
jgi:hypothetical protein